jgi:hypothetical protein
MWFFCKRKEQPSRRNRIVRQVIVGFIIGSAITSIVGKKLLKERRKEHLGEDITE